MAITLLELAQRTGAELQGKGDCVIEAVADIASAPPGAISFVSDPAYRKYIATTRASALIVTEELRGECRMPALITDNPRLVYAHVANLVFPAESWSPGISGEACIAPSAKVSVSACVEAGAFIADGVVVGDHSYIGANAVIEHDAVVGSRSAVRANVTIGHDCVVGDHCILHSGCVLGADGFGFVRDGSGDCVSNIKIPQAGRVVIGDDVEIGANTCIDRGALEDTVVGNGVKLDNLVQIGHSVRIGDNTIMSAMCAVAGSTVIGANCMFGGCSAVREHITIADGVVVTARTIVTRSITEPGASVSSGTPMDDTVTWRKNSARFRRLDSMARRLSELEKQLDQHLSQHEE